MPFFNWFSSKSDAAKKAAPSSTRPPQRSKPALAQDRSLPPAGHEPMTPQAQQVDRKVKRHARREQLYVAIRECMTRAGVLSASYKFKVLSLDQRGDQFLVMMDVAPGLGSQAEKLSEIETLLISTAKSLFSIFVTSVYWRTDNRPAAANAVNFGVSQPAALESQPLPLEAAKTALKKPAAQRYDPIHDDEMAAFKQALTAASAQHPATPDGTGKSRSGLRSFTLITGFEDTEMPESSAAPALSATQYGELR
jgi:hypothetical protein